MKNKIIFSAVFLSMFFCGHIFSQNIEVKITGLQNTKGEVQLGIFTSQSNYETENSLFRKVFSKSKVVNGEITVYIELKAGTYGIAVLDDIDCDGLMKYNFFGIPREGFGFSNYKSTGFKNPHFDCFKFTVRDSKIKTKVHVPIRYIL